MILTNEFIQGLDQYIKANYDIYSHIEIQVVTVQEKSTPCANIPKRKELTRNQSVDLQR